MCVEWRLVESRVKSSDRGSLLEDLERWMPRLGGMTLCL